MRELSGTAGTVFDIEEFGVYDGPGIRSVIFLKGCPLRCQWCHNPEGQSFARERMVYPDLCARCGRCEAVCPSKERCLLCGACERVCPRRAIRICGTVMTTGQVAARVLRNERLLVMNGGGITFSGGEALCQPDFVLAVRELLPALHAAVETCGHVEAETFARVARRMDLILFDVKILDGELHRRYTGLSNELILTNLRWLMRSGIPFRARTPLIPGVNDDSAHFEALADLLAGAKNLLGVDLMTYNRAAGAKYRALGREYRPDFDEDAQVNVETRPFEARGIEVKVYQ